MAWTDETLPGGGGALADPGLGVDGLFEEDVLWEAETLPSSSWSAETLP